jgi:hypothetical protein
MQRNINNLFKKLSNFGSVKPVSNIFGFERGLPIDRYYIEKFLRKNKRFIKGTVIEISEATYTKEFGCKVTKSLILSYSIGTGVDIVGDLSTGKGIPKGIADSVILTQTLSFIYDVHSAIKNVLKMLKPGGYLLVTVPGITQISRYDMDRWGQYWSFTDLSLRRLFEKFVPRNNIEVETYGNVKAASSLLYGLASEELSKEDLNYKDPDYQMIISARVKKPDK